MAKNPQSNARNEALESLYCRHWARLREMRSRFQIESKPYLVRVHPNYELAEKRLVVVGKETNGWGNEVEIDGRSAADAVAALMEVYENFRFGEQYDGKAAFWVPVSELYGRINPEGPAYGFVALNASKFDQGQGTPNDEVRDAIIETSLLLEEIRILDPHIVVFLTGPRYESWLDRWFPDLKRSGDEWFCQMAASGLPKYSFRTYHPQYLNRAGRRIEIFDRILAAVTEAH